MNQQITSWSDSLMASLSTALALLFAAVPKVLGFLIILAIGWLVASLIERVLVAVLRALRVDSFVERAGLAGMVRTLKHEPSAMLGTIVKWFVRLITLVAAFDALGVPAVAQVFNQLLLWVPNLAVALIVLVVGGIAANALADVVRGASARARFDRPELLASIARWAVWAFAALIAVNQIGVASALVDILFLAVVGAIALALGLSFGLGARDTAGTIVRNAYERNRRHVAGAVGSTLSAANAPSGIPYTGIEHRRSLVADRRNNGVVRRETMP
jgi:hypothetical protein